MQPKSPEPLVGPSMRADLASLRTVVQRNCDVSDAVHARSYTLCTYLLKMREYFRWEKGYALTAALAGDAVGDWVEQREQLWESLAWQDYACLPLAAHCYDPFDHVSINRALVPQGLVYSGGYGRFGKPHFFLASLLTVEQHRDLTVYISSSEYARDLTAPPAMIQGKHVFVRRESLRRSLWELVEEWRWAKREGPMARVVAYYGVDQHPEAALEHMTDDQVVTAVLHEVGEAMAGERLGTAWDEMLVALSGSNAELVARAVRDHLADCLLTLPTLLEQKEALPIHCYFASLRGLRRQLFPESVRAYQHWMDNGTLAALQSAVQQGSERFECLAKAMLDRHGAHGSDLARAIEDLVDWPGRRGEQAGQGAGQ